MSFFTISLSISTMSMFVIFHADLHSNSMRLELMWPAVGFWGTLNLRPLCCYWLCSNLLFTKPDWLRVHVGARESSLPSTDGRKGGKSAGRRRELLFRGWTSEPQTELLYFPDSSIWIQVKPYLDFFFQAGLLPSPVIFFFEILRFWSVLAVHGSMTEPRAQNFLSYASCASRVAGRRRVRHW